jgi:hypothetical protein
MLENEEGAIATPFFLLLPADSKQWEIIIFIYPYRKTNDLKLG